MPKYKCNICKKSWDKSEDLYLHVETDHSDILPEKWSGARWVFYTKHDRDYGKCMICGGKTLWNDSTCRPNSLCKNPRCKEVYVNRFKERMVKKYGKEHLLNDPNVQKKMLSNRSISGQYRWSDNSYKNYVGSYEKDSLQFLDLFMNMESEDIITPAPQIISYKYEGKDHFYIPDMFIISINTIIEIKDGGDNPNTHPKIQAVDKEKERLKDAAISKSGYNYIKIVNKQYGPLINFLAKLRSMDIDIKTSNDKPLIMINEQIDLIRANVELQEGFKDDIYVYLYEKAIGIYNLLGFSIGMDGDIYSFIIDDEETCKYHIGKVEPPIDKPIYVFHVGVNEKHITTSYFTKNIYSYGLDSDPISVMFWHLSRLIEGLGWVEPDNLITIDDIYRNCTFKKVEVLNSSKNIEFEKSKIPEVKGMNWEALTYLSEQVDEHLKHKDTPEEKYGLPSQKEFPLNDETDVLQSMRKFHRCPDENKEELAKNISKAAKKFNITLYPEIIRCICESYIVTDINIEDVISGINTSRYILHNMKTVLCNIINLSDTFNNYELHIALRYVIYNTEKDEVVQFNASQFIKNKIELLSHDIECHEALKDIYDDIDSIINNFDNYTLELIKYYLSITDDNKRILFMNYIGFLVKVDIYSDKTSVLSKILDFIPMNNKVLNEQLYDDNYVPVFILLTYTGTPISKVIKAYTKQPYSHASLSLDPELKQLYSFNSLGFVQEDIHKDVFIENDVSYGLYVTFVTKENFNKLKNKIKEFKGNKNLKYNKLGLLGVALNKPIEVTNSYFCSQFVSQVLKDIGVNIYDKIPPLLTPYDLSKPANIYFITEGKIKDYNSKNVNTIVTRIKNSAIKVPEMINNNVVNESENIPTTILESIIDSSDLTTILNYYKNFNITLNEHLTNKIDIEVNRINTLSKKYLSLTEAYFKNKDNTLNVKIDPEGSIIIKKQEKTDFMSMYASSHRLMKVYEKNNSIDSIKCELCKLYYMNMIIESKFVHSDKPNLEDSKYKEALKSRAFILNDFNKYLDIVLKSDKGFNFYKYFNQSPYGSYVYKIDTNIYSLFKNIANVVF